MYVLLVYDAVLIDSLYTFLGRERSEEACGSVHKRTGRSNRRQRYHQLE